AGPRSPLGRQDAGRGLPRAPTPAAPVRFLEGYLPGTRSDPLRNRRAPQRRRSPHRRPGAPRGPPGGGDRSAKKSFEHLGVSPKEKRAVIATLSEEYPVGFLCRLLGVARSSVYHRPAPRDERALKGALLTLAGEWPTYGYRRLTVMLRRT